MKKIMGFFGGDSQTGTTMLAQSVAELLKKREQKVLLIQGSGKYGREFYNLTERHSIDDLRAAIRSGKVSFEDFSQTMEEYEGLYLIPSVRNPFTAKYFPENTYEIMLSSVKDQFDYIVIDGGDNPNLGLTISALNISDEKFFVTTQQSKSIQRLAVLKAGILDPLNLTGRLIINKYVKDPALMLKKDILGVLGVCGMEETFTIPYIEYGWQAEMEGRTLNHFGKYEKNVSQIVDIFEPEEKEGTNGKRILLRRLSK